jgi:hypothetical protein
MTAITDDPVRYTSFLSVKLAAKPPVKNALPSMLAVSNPPSEQRALLQKRTLEPAPAVPGSPHASAAPSANAAADAGDWKDFVSHLQQQGTVPGAGRADPDQGVMRTSNVKVKQMLAYLGNQPSATRAGVDPLVRPGPATVAAGAGSAPVSPATGVSTHAAADAGDWKDYVGHLQQQGKVPGAGRADPDQGVVRPSTIRVTQMLAYFRNQPPATPADMAKVVSPPAPAAAMDVAAAAEPATVPSMSLLQDDEPVSADDPWNVTEPLEQMEQMEQMEHQHRAAGIGAGVIDPQPLEEDRTMDGEPGVLADAQRPRGTELPMIHEEHDEDPFHPSELFGTMPRTELDRLRREAMLRGNAALEEEDAEQVMSPQGRRGTVRFDEIETSRLLEVDAESGESVSVTDAFFLTKEHDGKWGRSQSKQSISPERVSDNAGTGPRLAAFAPPRVPTTADESGFVVHSAFHEDRYDQPAHAEIGETFWADLGRDDEPAEPGVGEAFLQLQQLQELHRKLEAALRHNQQLKEEVGVYF